MQNFEDLKEKIFFEAKNIIETLSKISTQEELLLKKDLIEELDERISFLKLLEKNQDYFLINEPLQSSENEDVNYSENNSEEEDVEEEVLFTNELNEIHKDQEENEEKEFQDEPDFSEIKSEMTIQFPEITETIVETIQVNEPHENAEEISSVSSFDEEYRRNVEEKERELRELEERRRTIVEFEKKEPQEKPEKTEPENLTEIQQQHHEQAKKFKLAHIKGLKTVESLFDDDPLENLTNTHTEIPKENEKPHETGSLLKGNMPTDFMEAEKPKPEFRLDLNDKIAFSKTLFGGSQADLNEAIRHLNDFKNLEDAKEYLSDLYYERNWKKADEFAQRLWTLVENKFL